MLFQQAESLDRAIERGLLLSRQIVFAERIHAKTFSVGLLARIERFPIGRARPIETSVLRIPEMMIKIIIRPLRDREGGGIMIFAISSRKRP